MRRSAIYAWSCLLINATELEKRLVFHSNLQVEAKSSLSAMSVGARTISGKLNQKAVVTGQTRNSFQESRDLNVGVLAKRRQLAPRYHGSNRVKTNFTKSQRSKPLIKNEATNVQRR